MSSAAEQERITFLSSCFSLLLQPSQRADPASTTAGSTRTGRASSPTVNTSAHASTVRWDVSRCARRNSPCPTWAVRTHDWLKWRASAARSGCATMASRPTSWKESLAKTCWLMSWREISPTRMSSFPLLMGDSSLYLVRKCFFVEIQCFWMSTYKTLKILGILMTVMSSGTAAFRPQPEVQLFDNHKCIVQTTPWSQCSKSCGTGISTRVTNHNSECKLVKETRICEVRPCTQSPYSSLKVSLSRVSSGDVIRKMHSCWVRTRGWSRPLPSFFLCRKERSAAEPRSPASRWSSPTPAAPAWRSTSPSTAAPAWTAAAAALTSPEPSASSSAARTVRPSTRTSWWSSPASAPTTARMSTKPPTPSTASPTTSTSSETNRRRNNTRLRERKASCVVRAAKGDLDECRGVNNRLPFNYRLLVVTRFPRNCGLTSWGLNEVHCLLWIRQHSHLRTASY